MSARARSRSGSARGFALASAIFLLVILSALAAFLVNISMTASVSSALDLQGARAYHAARAGIDWALYQVLDPANATVVAPGEPTWPHMPDCAKGPIAIEEFSVFVTCTSTDYLEAGATRSIRVYSIASNASIGIPGTLGRVEREVVAVVSLCRALDGSAPSYACQ